MKNSVQSQSGQVLLLVVLAMSVATTLVLSIVSRSITEVSITTDEDESLRALSAAEAGVERALVGSFTSGSNLTGDLGLTQTDNDSSFNTSVNEFPNSREYAYPLDIRSGEAATIWLIPHDTNGNPDDSCSSGACFTGSRIRLCWGEDNTNRNQSTTPALVASLTYEDGGSLKAVATALDPNNNRTNSNSFDSSVAQNCQIAGKEFQFRKDIDFNSDLGIPASVFNNAGNLKFLRIQSLYNTSTKHPLGIQVLTGSNLPSQGRKVDSVGSSGVSSRKIEVFSLFPEPPSIFDSAIFSGTNLIK